MIVPTGISFSFKAFPGTISAPAPEITFSPTDSLSGAIIYLFSPSTYVKSAILAVLFGSYSMADTVAGIPSLSLLKSIIL